jgi:protein-arginine kinase activator protein McsA
MPKTCEKCGKAPAIANVRGLPGPGVDFWVCKACANELVNARENQEIAEADADLTEQLRQGGRLS